MEEKDNMNEEENIFKAYAKVFCDNYNNGEPDFPREGVTFEENYNEPYFKDIETALASRVSGYDVARKVPGYDKKFYEKYEVSLAKSGLAMFGASTSALSKNVEISNEYVKNFGLILSPDMSPHYGNLELVIFGKGLVDPLYRVLHIAEKNLVDRFHGQRFLKFLDTSTVHRVTPDEVGH